MQNKLRFMLACALAVVVAGLQVPNGSFKAAPVVGNDMWNADVDQHLRRILHVLARVCAHLNKNKWPV